MDMLYLAPIASFVAILFVIYLVWFRILNKDMGTERMRQISEAIREGSMAFLNRQYKTIYLIAAAFAIVLAIVIKDGGKTAFAFMVGSIFSGVAGYVGMMVAARSSARTAKAAEGGVNKALQIAYSGGAVMGLSVVALSLLGVTFMYWWYGSPESIVGLGFGASFVALFAQLGGGIFTKSADVGADLVGKVEAGIPEDDPRNPAVIADNVGDMVGDCAGRGADLFESATAENIGGMILGVAMWKITGIFGFIIFPLIARALGIFASIIGMLFVRTSEDGDAMSAMNKGMYVSSILCAGAFYFLTQTLLGGNIYFFYAGLVGIATNILIGWITQYYTERKYRPVQDIANSAKTGPATDILAGFAVGLESTALPVIVLSVAILLSYKFGSTMGVLGGLYGTAVATMGMLSTAGVILAMDGYGPIADNAGGITEMANLPEEVRKTTDKLDAVGNTTKALTKGFAMGSAALSAFLLFAAYLETVGLTITSGGITKHLVNIADPPVFIGLFVGGALPFLFSSFAIRAVGRAAFQMVNEVRRQFREIPGILEGKGKPDYTKCVDISTKAALKEMVLPSLLVVVTPIVVGMTLGKEAVGALLMGATVTGVLLAMLMNNGGAAWDNAKKFIEAGNLGGKGSDTHKAAVVGDTVGDPFKDTAGPSLHVLVKLLNTISLSLASLFR